MKIIPKTPAVTGNIVVFAASSGEQVALPYKEKSHGMFTYFLLKKLQESKGDIAYKALADFIEYEVQLNAVKINGKDQNPAILISGEMEGVWGGFRMK